MSNLEDEEKIKENNDNPNVINESTTKLQNENKLINHRIPLLEEVLQLCKGKIFLNLEIKDWDFALCLNEVISLVEKHDMSHQIAISSFKHQYWELIKKRNENEIEFGFLYDTCDGQKCDFVIEEGRRHSTLNLWYKEVNPEIVANAHEKGIAVHCWFCMKDEETEEIHRYLMQCGLDVICTNNPRLALKVREEVFGKDE